MSRGTIELVKVAIVVGAAVLIASCSSQQTSSPSPPASSSSPAPIPPKAVASASVLASASVSTDSGAPTSSAAGVEEEPEKEPTFDEIVTVLFADRADTRAITGTTCPSSTPADARIRCLFDERYKGDSKAAGLAHEMFIKWRIVSGVEVAHTMDGGYRGMIRIEPAVPITTERKHIEWIATAMRDIDSVFTDLEKWGADHKDQVAAPSTPKKPKRYRFKPLTLRFMRSVAARTPSAYAHDWTVVWNLAGSLNISADMTRETLVHEIFHLNDYAHPPAGGASDAWSLKALNTTFDAIVKKCGTAIPCLTPFTPNETIVRGGTYYSFQPGNGVREYAAELALRYFREQRAVLKSLPKVKPFKCGPPENLKSWNAMRDEFWNGIDAVPPC